MKEYLFSGAGNTFVVLDGRKGLPGGLDRAWIVDRCRVHCTDGLMVLGPDAAADFRMEFYNPDGSGGMMCGNGGRCIVAFADFLGMQPQAADGCWVFRAPDGLHEATLLQCPAPGRPSWTVRLKMVDVEGVETLRSGCFLNTGTRHLVRFVDDPDAVEVEKEGPLYRHDPAFAPEGTNVNFVGVFPDGLHVRTFEKGVEGETLACGTGLTASAIAAFSAGKAPGEPLGKAVRYRLQCRRGDWLSVEFVPEDGRYHDVYLTGPAEILENE